MPLEIEHKYLVINQNWKEIEPVNIEKIQQGYLFDDKIKSVRIRLKNENGFLTIKSKISESIRNEYEYEIPYLDAEELLFSINKNKIIKTRYTLLFENNTWEVDVFEGENEGLIVAEIELPFENHNYIKPGWIGENITSSPKYLNSNLFENPFKNWIL